MLFGTERGGDKKKVCLKGHLQNFCLRVAGGFDFQLRGSGISLEGKPGMLCRFGGSGSVGGGLREGSSGKRENGGKARRHALLGMCPRHWQPGCLTQEAKAIDLQGTRWGLGSMGKKRGLMCRQRDLRAKGDKAKEGGSWVNSFSTEEEQ